MSSPLPPTLTSTLDLIVTPVTSEDLDFELAAESKELLKKFDIAWRSFMNENPDLLPQGKREENICKLQKQVEETIKTQKEVNEELQKQLDFFEKSKETMEEGFAKDTEAAKKKEEKIRTKLQLQLDNVAISEHQLSQTIPWNNFLEATDKVAEIKSRGEKEDTFWNSLNDNTIMKIDKKAKPSARAMALVDDSSGELRDIQLRAYQIDNALLKTHIKMLQQEADGYGKYLESQRAIEKFLNENNVYALVTDNNSKEQGSVVTE